MNTSATATVDLQLVTHRHTTGAYTELRVADGLLVHHDGHTAVLRLRDPDLCREVADALRAAAALLEAHERATPDVVPTEAGAA